MRFLDFPLKVFAYLIVIYTLLLIFFSGPENGGKLRRGTMCVCVCVFVLEGGRERP